MNNLLPLLSALPIRCRHSGFSISSGSYILYPPPSLQPQPCPLHHIHKPPFWPSPFPISWQLHPQHPSPNIPIILPPYTSIPPQSCLSCFLSTQSHLSYTHYEQCRRIYKSVAEKRDNITETLSNKQLFRSTFM